jgi:hypothetical protein
MLNRLLIKHAIRKADNHDALGLEDAVDFGENGFGVLQILHGYCIQHCIKALIRQRQLQILIEILHKVMIQPRIAGQFFCIQSMPLHMRKLHLIRQVRYPTAHQIQNTHLRFEAIAIELGQRIDKALIHMGDKAGILIK